MAKQRGAQKVMAQKRGGHKAPACEQRRKPLQKSKVPKLKRGGREALSMDQVVHFYHVLLRDLNCAWAAVMFVLGVLLGERAELLCNVEDAWFTGLDPSQGMLPQCFIKSINKKTKTREIPLNGAFGHLMWTWVTGDPLLGGHEAGVESRTRTQWPHQGQVLFQRRRRRGKQPLGRFLFPGRALGGNDERQWNKPISSRGFFGKFQEAQKLIIKQVQTAREQQQSHPFDGVCLKRVTTHSIKKSAVTLLKTAGTSTAIVAAITGTSARVLDRVYDVPTQKRQREAGQVFQPFIQALMPEGSSDSMPSSGPRTAFCIQCGQELDSAWLFCRFCGQKQPRS